MPRKKTHRLQHRNIFIVPSKTSLGLLVLIFLLWLLGTNYQNNLVLVMAFLLLALIVICIHHTYAALAGLEISVKITRPGFVGELGDVELFIKRLNSRVYESLEFKWSESRSVNVNLIDEDSVNISLTVPIEYRGWFQPERLKISTTFPLGLIYAWSYLDLEAPILAYPKPIESAAQAEQQNTDELNDLEHHPLSAGHEEFAGLREYQDGDSLRNIDWRTLAKGQGLATRIYEDYVDQHLWLDWQQFEGLSREARLSRLCFCVLREHERTKNLPNLLYGLRLPNISIEPDQGETHKNKLLKTLALFEVELAELGRDN